MSKAVLGDQQEERHGFLAVLWDTGFMGHPPNPQILLPGNQQGDLMRTLFLAAALAGAVMLSGCSSPTEDVRITLCKNLVLTLSEPPLAVEWKETDNKFARFEDLIISVNGEFLTQDEEPTAMQATCFYEFDEAIEEDGMTHVDPLSTYKTVPHKMLLNGESIPKPVLDRAVQTAILIQGKEAVGKIKQNVNEVTRKVKDKGI